SVDNRLLLSGRDLLADMSSFVNAPKRCSRWTFEHITASIGADEVLHFEFEQPLVIRWTTDGWNSMSDVFGTRKNLDGKYSIHIVPPKQCDKIEFTMFWIDHNKWE